MLKNITFSFIFTFVFLFSAIWAQAQESDCLAPDDVTYTLTDDSIDFTWSDNDTISSTNFRYKELGSPDWIVAENVGNSYSILNAGLCISYEYQLQNTCYAILSDWSDTEIVSSFGCCENPAELLYSVIDNENILINWPVVEAAISYNFRFKLVGSMDWIELNVTETEFGFSNFLPCEEYEFQIQTVCETDSEPYSESLILLTPTCQDACISLPYCKVNGYNSDGQHIGLVQLNTINNTTGSNDGYGDFTSEISTDLVPGETYEITLEPIYTGDFLPESFGVWIDFNQNGEFEISEQVLARDTIVSIFTQSIILPSSAIYGNTRMRVAMQHTIPPNACNDESFMYDGEAEDYCINFICPSFLIQDTTFTSSSEIGLEFLSSNFVDENILSFRKVGETEWQEFSIDANEIVVDGLDACSDYEFRTRTLCGNSYTEFTEPVVYSTTCLSSIENSKIQTIRLYPNPFEDYLSFDFGDLEVENIKYRLMNSLGEDVKSGRFEGTENQIIQLNNIPQGVYYLQLNIGERTIFYKKVIKS